MSECFTKEHGSAVAVSQWLTDYAGVTVRRNDYGHPINWTPLPPA